MLARWFVIKALLVLSIRVKPNITMMTLGWIAMLAMVFSACTGQEDPIQYSASLIRYLSDQSTGVFDCWIFQLSSDPEQHDTMDQLLQSDEVAIIPKRLISTKHSRIPIDREPKLILIFTDYHTAALGELCWLMFNLDTKESVKIIVFYQDSGSRHLVRIISVFVSAKLFNVILVRTDQLEIHYAIRYRHEFLGWNNPVAFEDLFVDQTADLAGYPVRISFSVVMMDNVISNKKNVVNGPVTEWVLSTIEHVNGTYEIYKITCDEEEEGSEKCFRKQRVFDAKTTFDFVLEPLTFDHVDSQFLSSSIPDHLLVAAPRGRQFTVYELFVIPFDVHVWTLLIALGIVCCLIMLIYPDLFRNDLILTPLCGFERQSLNKVSQLEKFLIFPLIVISFIMCSAYESKIVAYMTSFPTVPNPRSFEDLLQSNIIIHAESIDFFGSESDPRYTQVFMYSPSNNLLPIDPSNTKLAYCGRSREIQFLVDHPIAYDPSTKHSRLIILDQFSIGQVVPFYFVGRRNPLKDRFRKSELTFYEAGLVDLWARRFLYQIFGIQYGARIAAAEKSTGNELGMDRLGPVCVLWAVGCAVATLVFAVEWVWVLMKLHGRKVIQNIIVDQMHRILFQVFSNPFLPFKAVITSKRTKGLTKE